MTLRSILGLGWSFVAGLAGGWLLLAPWALGEQGSGDWTVVTRNEVAAGGGLIALALVGIAVVGVQAIRTLREAGGLAPPRAPARTNGVTTSADMEQALIALAQALAEDLDAQREPAARSRTGGEPSWRQPS